jgi:hypothetical protein
MAEPKNRFQAGQGISVGALSRLRVNLIIGVAFESFSNSFE